MVFVRRWLLDVCGAHLLDIGELVLQQLERLDGPLASLFVYIEPLFDPIKQFFSNLSSSSSSTDVVSDDFESPLIPPPAPDPPAHQSTVTPYRAGPPTMSPQERRSGADVIEAPVALDLSVRRVQSTASADSAHPVRYPPQATATRASQFTLSPEASATRGWNPQTPQVGAASARTPYTSKKNVTFAPSVRPPVPNSGDTLVQSSCATSPQRQHQHAAVGASSLRPGMSVSRLKRQWSDAFWNPQTPQVGAASARTPYTSKTTVTLAPSVRPPVPKAGDTLVQSSCATFPQRQHQQVAVAASTLRPGKSVSRRKRQWSEAFCTEPDPVRCHPPPATATAPLIHEEPPLKYRRLAPVSYEQRSVYEGIVAPQSREQPPLSHHQFAPVNRAQQSVLKIPVATVSSEQRSVYESQVAPRSLAQRSIPGLPLAPVNVEQPYVSRRHLAPPSHAQRPIPQPRAAPDNYEQRPVREGPAAPQSLAQPSLSHGAVAPTSHEQCQQRLVAGLPDARAAIAKSSEVSVHRGLSNGGNVYYVMKSPEVIPELEAAIRHSADKDSRSLIFVLSPLR